MASKSISIVAIALNSNFRVIAVRILLSVFSGETLDQALNAYKSHDDYSLIAELCFGSLRYFERLDFIAYKLLQKPLKEKDEDIQLLIIIGLYQLLFLSKKTHAIVNETVNSVKAFKKPWAKNLINAVLRRFLREKDLLSSEIEKDITAKYCHPTWLIELIEKQYPAHWQAILNANLTRAPLSLRINSNKSSIDKAKSLLTESNIAFTTGRFSLACITLDDPIDVNKIPGFFDGLFSVQDQASQLVTGILDPQVHEKILDACAAPGGKTCALLERENTLKLTALDISEKRLNKVKQNLQRLGLQATLVCADAQTFSGINQDGLFDKILLDAPCSALGVIRRHPDIKFLRDEKQVQAIIKLQQTILNQLWALLKPGGRLLYATCSVLSQENHLQIECFLQQAKDAREIVLQKNWGIAMPHGRQILPGQDGMDGFYYCLLAKGTKMGNLET